jgi:hypothetical protein
MFMDSFDDLNALLAAGASGPLYQFRRLDRQATVIGSHGDAFSAGLGHRDPAVPLYINVRECGGGWGRRDAAE